METRTSGWPRVRDSTADRTHNCPLEVRSGSRCTRTMAWPSWCGGEEPVRFGHDECVLLVERLDPHHECLRVESDAANVLVGDHPRDPGRTTRAATAIFCHVGTRTRAEKTS